MSGDLNKVTFILVQFFQRLIGTIQLIHPLLDHAFHHLIEAIQIIIQTGIFQGNGGLNRKGVCQ